MVADNPPTPKARRGFAAMDPEKQREIARRGGKAVPAESRAFSLYPALASEAGRKGGTNLPREKRSFNDHETAVRAGKLGGLASAKARRRKRSERALARGMETA